MDTAQLDKIYAALNRVAAATLAAAVIRGITRKATLKEIQDAFNDCYMIVNPSHGTTEQEAFQERMDKREW